MNTDLIIEKGVPWSPKIHHTLNCWLTKQRMQHSLIKPTCAVGPRVTALGSFLHDGLLRQVCIGMIRDIREGTQYRRQIQALPYC
jgi:hypothetical protein